MSDQHHLTEKQLRHCCKEMDRRLRGGERTRAEDFLAACPELSQDAEMALDLIYHEFVVRSELGHAPVAEEYYDRFPQWRAQLAHQFQVHDVLGPGSGATPRGAPGAPPGDLGEPSPWPNNMPPPRPWKNNPPSFEILDEIARGSMGVVYRAWQKTVRRVVALKIILARSLSSASDMARFQQEAEATGRLVHPNIAQIFKIDKWEHCPFLVLEYVDGCSLADHWSGDPRPTNETATLIRTIALAVQFAHERGVVHRDLRSGNVLLTKEGAPKIIDFGLAKLTVSDQQLTVQGQVLGTPSYMAPEQAAGRNDDVGAAVDVYALGAMLYEGLTCRPPFRGNTILDTLQQVVGDEVTPPRRLVAGVPRDLETICLKCLEKDPHKRYASAAALADDLQRFLTGEPIHARRVHVAERFWRWCARNPVVANLLLALLVVLTAGLLLVTWKWRQEAEARADAESAQRSAMLERGKARDEKFKADRLTVGIILDQAMNQGEHGNIDHALLLLGRCLEQATANEDPALERVVRVNLSAMRGYLARRRASLPHPDWAWTIVYAPDGKRFATGCKDKAVRLFDTATGHPTAEPLIHEHPVWSVAFSPDGQILVTGCGNQEGTAGSVQLWSAAKGVPLGAPLLTGKPIQQVAFAAGGALLVRDTERVQLWDLEKRVPLGEPLAHPGRVLTAALDPEGKWVVTGGADGTARLWHVPSGEPAGPPLVHEGDAAPDPQRRTVIVAAAFSPDGHTVATASQVVDVVSQRFVGGAVRVWQTASGAPAGPPLIHNGPLKTLAFSPDGRRLLTGSFQHHDKKPETFRGEARVWDIESALPLTAPLEHQQPVWAVAFSRNGRVLLTGGEEGFSRFWLTATGQRLANFSALGNAKALALAPDGQTMVVGHTYTPALAELWEVPPGFGGVSPPRHTKAIQSLQASADGALLVTGSEDGTAQIWDARTGAPHGAPLPHSLGLRPLNFHPEGKLVLTAPQPRNLQLWATSGTSHGPALEHQNDVVAALFNPDGQTLLTCDADRRLYHWDLKSGKTIRPAAETGADKVHLLLRGKTPCAGLVEKHKLRLWSHQASDAPAFDHAEPVIAVAVSPCTHWIATASTDNTAQLWNAATGAARGKPLVHPAVVDGLVFSPDGKLLLTWSAANYCRIWKTATAASIGPPLQHPSEIAEARFTPDGRTLIVASGNAVWLWDVATGKRLGVPLKHPGVVSHLAVHPDGDKFYTACEDRMIRTWEIPTPAQGASEQINQWIEVLTGRKLSATGTLEEIAPDAILTRRRELEATASDPFSARK